MTILSKLEVLLENSRYEDYFSVPDSVLSEDGYAGLITGPIKLAFGALKLPFKAAKGGYKFVSKAAKTIDGILDKIDIAKFQKSIGAKDLKEVDLHLARMRIDDDDFRPILNDLFTKLKKSRKRNEELYKSLKPIYEKHKKREIEFYEKRLRTAVKNDNIQDQELYSNAILAMTAEVEKDSPLYDEITSAISEFHDVKSKMDYESIYRKVETEDGPQEARSKEELAKVPIVKMTDAEIVKMAAIYAKSIEKGMDRLWNSDGTANFEAAGLMSKWKRLLGEIEKEARKRGIELD